MLSNKLFVVLIVATLFSHSLQMSLDFKGFDLNAMSNMFNKFNKGSLGNLKINDLANFNIKDLTNGNEMPKMPKIDPKEICEMDAKVNKTLATFNNPQAVANMLNTAKLMAAEQALKCWNNRSAISQQMLDAFQKAAPECYANMTTLLTNKDKILAINGCQMATQMNEKMKNVTKEQIQAAQPVMKALGRCMKDSMPKVMNSFMTTYSGQLLGMASSNMNQIMELVNIIKSSSFGPMLEGSMGSLGSMGNMMNLLQG